MTVIVVNDINWRDFQIGGEEGIFSIKSSVSEIDKKNLNDEVGEIPYVTRTDLNNGIAMYVTRDQDEKYITNKGNVISIGLDTQTIFYQPNEFYTGQNIQILSHEKLNEDIARYLIPLLKVQLSKFSWGGNGATLKRLNNSRIMLPINENDEPDWEYMECEGKNLYSNQIFKLRNYLENKIKTLSIPKEVEELTNKKWLPFEIEEVSTILSGKDIYARERVEGNLPYITSGASNNGIGYFVGNDNSSKSKDIISVNRNGAVGYAFYHPYEALFGNDTRRVIPNYKNKYSSLFLSHMITMQKEKYGYGLKMGSARLKRQKIMLPVDKENQPDWKFMENYMKQVEFNQLTKLINYLN